MAVYEITREVPSWPRTITYTKKTPITRDFKAASEIKKHVNGVMSTKYRVPEVSRHLATAAPERQWNSSAKTHRT